jgi:hypothetical protein
MTHANLLHYYPTQGSKHSDYIERHVGGGGGGGICLAEP